MTNPTNEWRVHTETFYNVDLCFGPTQARFGATGKPVLDFCDVPSAFENHSEQCYSHLEEANISKRFLKFTSSATSTDLLITNYIPAQYDPYTVDGHRSHHSLECLAPYHVFPSP